MKSGLLGQYESFAKDETSKAGRTLEIKGLGDVIDPHVHLDKLRANKHLGRQREIDMCTSTNLLRPKRRMVFGTCRTMSGTVGTGKRT